LKIYWASIVFLFLLLIIFEMVIYMLFLMIKALRIYIHEKSITNQTGQPRAEARKPVKGILIVAGCNILLMAVMIAGFYIQSKRDVYYTENVIQCENKSDVQTFTELLDQNDIAYDVLGSTRVKIQNDSDYLEALEIIKENGISFSTITIEH